MATPAPDDLGFTWRRFQRGDIEIRRHGRRVATLRGKEAERFLASLSRGDEQQVMARVTGNYRRGNERR
jgi:hypothetical protein